MIVDHTDLVDAFKGRTVLVTGDTGFTGSWLCVWLSRCGAKVVGVARPPIGPESLFSHIARPAGLEHVDLDITDFAKLKDVFGRVRPAIVFHLAAQALVRRSYFDPVDTFASNTIGTVHLLEACRATSGVQAAVLITTDKVYRNAEMPRAYSENDPLGGHDPYSASKAAAELVIECYRKSYLGEGMPSLAVARAGNIIGGGDWAEDRIVPDIIRAIVSRSPLTIRNPNAIRPFQHVLAACHAYLLLGSCLIHGNQMAASEWNFGPLPSEHRSVQSLIDAFGQRWVLPEIRPEVSTKKEAMSLCLDSTRARTQLGWTPAWNFDETMERTVNWYKSFYSGQRSAMELCLHDIDDYQMATNARH